MPLSADLISRGRDDRELPTSGREQAQQGVPLIRSPRRRGREMIDLLAVEEPKPKPAKIRAVSYEAAIDQLFKRMR